MVALVEARAGHRSTPPGGCYDRAGFSSASPVRCRSRPTGVARQGRSAAATRSLPELLGHDARGRRRLALIAASNVTDENELRRPEPGGRTIRARTERTRRERSGAVVSRPATRTTSFSSPMCSSPRTAGPSTRATSCGATTWPGADLELLRRANGDTYHITNCSPQMAGFNRSTGDDNWGDLENHVLSEARQASGSAVRGTGARRRRQGVRRRGRSGRQLRAKIPRDTGR